MARDVIENTIEDLGKLAGTWPSVLDLLNLRDLWSQLDHYWVVLCEEIERRRGRSHPIRALDFDLIYPTIWSDTAQSPLELEERMGFPMTASFIFRDTQTYFTIPPGALFELFFHSLKLQQAYELSESRLNQIMRKVSGTPGEVSESDSGYGTRAGELLREALPAFDWEVNRLVDAGAKLDALTNILTHKYYRPWDEIEKNAGATANSMEILKLWKIFGAARTHPDKDLSNYLDALSVASYYSLSRAQAGGRTRDFPLFASGTGIVLNLGANVINTSEVNRPSLLQDVIHPVSIQYLAFATAMERYAEYDVTRLSTFTDSGLKQIQKLSRDWRRFWNDCRVLFPQREHVSEEEHFRSISLSRLVDISSFSTLCETYTEWRRDFRNTVGTIFIDITRADRQVSETYHLTRKHLLEKIRQRQPNVGRERLPPTIEDITSSFNWTPLAAIADSSLLFARPQRRRGYVSRGGLELLTLRQTRMLVEEAKVLSQPTPTLRTTIKLANIEEEVLLTWERSVGSASQLCFWSYDSNLKEALRCIGMFLAQAARKPMAARLNVFGDDSFEQKTFKSSLADVSWFDEILEITLNPKYIRIDTNVATVFLDAVPAPNTTRMEMAVMYEKSFHRLVAELYRSTCVFPLASSVVEAALREFAQDFTRKEPLITSLAKSQEALSTFRRSHNPEKVSLLK